MKDLPVLFLCLMAFAAFHGLRFQQSDLATVSTVAPAASTGDTRTTVELRQQHRPGQNWRIQGRYTSMQRAVHAAPPTPVQEAPEQWGFDYLDRNGDGYLSRRDARRDPMLLKHWEALDRDGDGYLQPFEYAYF